MIVIIIVDPKEYINPLVNSISFTFPTNLSTYETTLISLNTLPKVDDAKNPKGKIAIKSMTLCFKNFFLFLDVHNLMK